MLNGIDLLARLDVRTRVLSILDVLPLSTSELRPGSQERHISRTAGSENRRVEGPQIKSAHPPTPLPLPPRALPPAAPQHKAARTRFLLCQQCHRAAASSKRPPSPLSLPCRLSPRQRFAASSSTHETRMSMRSSRVLSSCDLCAVVQVCRGAMYRGALSHACARLRVSTCLYPG